MSKKFYEKQVGEFSSKGKGLSERGIYNYIIKIHNTLQI